MNRKSGLLLRALCALLLAAVLFSFTGCSSLLLFLSEAAAESTGAEPTATVSPTPTAAPQEPESAAPEPEPTEMPTAPSLTEEELQDALEAARIFFTGWFYNRNGKIDPAYSDWSRYPARTSSGETPLYPTDAGDIRTCADLLAATEVYFDDAVAAELLESIGAVDQDGRLYITKVDGLGGCSFEEWLTATQADDGSYTLDLTYAVPGYYEDRQTLTVQYIVTDDGHRVFSGHTETISNFFIVLTFCSSLEITVE
ncbi:MAG: hypothetical protein ACI4GO_09095 [Hominenteromicrobium sp.]